MTVFRKSRKFMYQNARPLDLARWQYHFENGTTDAVLSILEMYQNEDGGFGHGLEGDCFNPNSSPIQTWAATEILREIHCMDHTHPIIRGIIKYLSSGVDFDTDHKQWLNTVPSNNDYPHAIWWEYKEGEVEFKYNPTACLVGFFIKYGDRECDFYSTAVQIAQEAYHFWVSSMPYSEHHITTCFIRLYEYCVEAGIAIADMDEFKTKLIEQVQHELCGVVEEWGTNYVCMPSNFIKRKESIFYSTNTELITKECEHIVKSQLGDGSFVIPWQWWTEYKEFEIAKNWWKCDFCIKNMAFLKEFANSNWRDENVQRR